MTDAVICLSDSDDEPSTSTNRVLNSPPKQNTAKKSTAPKPNKPAANGSSSSGFARLNNQVRDKDTAEFLQNFNPDNSRREINKRNHILTKTVQPVRGNKKGTSLFDEHGRYRSTLEDACDCLSEVCPGCHFPCQTCQSTKCGLKCRVNRKWAYERVEFDGQTELHRINEHTKRIKSGF